MRIYVRSLFCWAVAANARLSFWLARCARGGCKWSETEFVRIDVRSLFCWAVAANARLRFWLARCAETEFVRMYVCSLCRWAVATDGRLSFWLARCARGGCKWLETEQARINVKFVSQLVSEVC